MSEEKIDPLLHALDEAGRKVETKKRCTLSFPEFFGAYPPALDYIIGRHTRAIMAELQAASEAVEKGGAYYAIISCPPRHGKSDLYSRRYPIWHLCRNPDHEVILATYGADLSEDMSHEARKCFVEAGPRWGLRLSDDRNQIGAWKIEGHRGGMFAIGFGGAVTGRGAHVLIVDDYCKNRAEAESELIRDRVWDSFRSDMLTRRAPNHAVIVGATRWHEDDMVARILQEMENNPDFPRFKLLNFPAQSESGDWLFPERFNAEWYKAQRAAVGDYAWQSLYLGDPRPRTGQLLRADLVEIADKMPEGLRWTRGWDLASTDKERIKDNPDFTVGTKAAFDGHKLYVADVVRGQWSAPRRDHAILEAAIKDGPGVYVRLETVAGYKDTYSNIKFMLSGKSYVRAVQPKGDKVARAAFLEPLFEAGKVVIQKAPWNQAWISEFLGFPKGKKDDQVDSLVVAAADLVSERRRMKIST